MKHLAACLAILCAPAGAAPILTTGPDGSGATVTLHDEAGPCEGEAKLAVWRSADAMRSVRGCWILGAGEVQVSFLDGERGNIPMVMLRKVRAS